MIDKDKFKMLRERARLSHSDVAKMVGLDEKAIQDIEYGYLKILDKDVMDLVGKVLGVKPNDLLK